MPGIHLIVDFKSHLRDKESRITQAQNSLIHDKRYYCKTLSFSSTHFIGYAKYDTYPINVYENSRFLTCVEGIIYNKKNSTIQEDIYQISEEIFISDDNARESITKWLLDSDGDYIVVVLDKISKKIAVINDALGRLPAYFYRDDERFFLSRETKFITALSERNTFDKTGIVEYLLFGHPLGERTLLEGVLRLQPATSIIIDPIMHHTKIESVYSYNFDNKKNKEKNLIDNVDRLKTLLVESCMNRANCIDNCQNVVSLSGGFDSRVVAVALETSGIQYSGATFLLKEQEIDARIAKRVASILKNIDWKLLEAAPPTFQDVLKLLTLKDGLNYVGMSFILSFFEQIVKLHHDQIIYFTGDGGPVLKPLTNIHHGNNIDTMDELVNSILEKYSVFLSLDEVGILTGFTKKDILDKIKEHIEKYPEKELKQKFVHFVIFEHCFKWSFEGEDRNRYYFWSVAPLYGIHFFDYAMNCPDEQKTNLKLYRTLIRELYPQVSNITSTNDILLSSRIISHPYITQIFDRLPRELKWCIKKLSLPIRKILARKHLQYAHNLDAEKCILDQITGCPSILNYFSEIELMKFIEKDIQKRKFDILFTVTSYIESIDRKYSSLKKYLSSLFI